MDTTVLIASLLLSFNTAVTDSSDSAAALDRQPLEAAMASPVTPAEPGVPPEPVDEFRGLAEPRVWDLDDWDAAEDAPGGGGIALHFGLYDPPRGDINNIARRLGFGDDDGTALGGAPLQMGGLRAFGHVGRNFRVGGLYSSGRDSLTLENEEDNFRRRLSFQVEQVGLTLEFVYPQRRWELYAGGLLGSSTYRFRYVQFDLDRLNTTLDWNETLNDLGTSGETGTFAKQFSNSFLIANPWVGGKYKLSPWFSIDANVGWLVGHASANQWIYTDSKFTLADAPSIRASGWTARLEATFGFFPF